MSDTTVTGEMGGDVAGAPIEAVESEFVALAGNLSAGWCRWLVLLAEIDRRGTWQAGGFRSVTQWLSARLGIASRTSRSHLAVARRLHDVPAVTAAFVRGEISFSQVLAITPTPPPAPPPA